MAIKNQPNQSTFPILSWVIIPLLVSWIALNYLIGIVKHPNRETDTATIKNVMSKQILETKTPSNNFTWQKTGLVTFWFDDAWITQYNIAFPELDSKQFIGALSVPIATIGNDAYMNWAQVKRLQYKGWEITSHSRSHNCEPDKLNGNQLEDELLGAKYDLAFQGLKSDLFVPPCGVSNSKLVQETKKYYTGLRTSDYGVNPLPVKDPYKLLVIEIDSSANITEISEWLDEVKKNPSWLILMFHKIDNSHERFSTTPENFTKIVDLVSKSNLPVVLPSQVLQISQ